MKVVQLVVVALLGISGLAWDPNCFRAVGHSFYDFNSLKK